MSEENTKDPKEKVKQKFNEIRSNVESFISDIKVDDLKRSFSLMMKEAQNDFNKIVTKDLEAMKKNFQREKVELEKKTKQFLSEQKKELNVLQTKLEKLMKKSEKVATAPAKKATKKAATKKAVTKKAPSAKKTSKKASKK